MSIQKPIEKVIKRIAPATVDTLKDNLDAERHRLIAVGKDGLVVKEKKSKIKSFFSKSSKSDLSYYLVTPGVDSDLIHIVCVISDQMAGKNINIKVTYQVTCIYGQEENLVEALHKGSSPENRITTLIKDWVRNFEKNLRRREDSLINSFFLHQHDLQDFLKNQLREQVHLESNLTLKLEDSRVESEITIDSQAFAVELADFKETINLQFQTKAKLASRNPIKAYTNYVRAGKIERLIQNTIVTYTSGLTVKQFLQRLSNKDFGDLMDELNEELRAYGRQVDHLSLNPESKLLELLEDKAIEDEFTYTISDRATREELTLRILYYFKAIPERAPDVIRALFNTKSNIKYKFQDCLTKEIKRFQEARQEAGVDIFSNFFDLIEDLKNELEQIAERRLGLKTRLNIQLVGEADIKNKTMHSDKFFARVQDYDAPLQFCIEAEFGVNPRNRIKTLTKTWNASTLEARIVEHIKREIRTSIPLHKLYRDPDKVSKHMISLVDEVVEPYGRKVNFFRLKRLSDLKVVEQENHDIKVECRIKDYRRKIIVENRLILKLNDLGNFHSKNIPDLKDWVQTTLDHIVQAELFEKNYVQVLTAIGDIEKNIKKEIDTKVKEIGYSINQHIVVPDLEHLKLKTEGFKIDRELEIPTNDHRVSARLQLIIRGEIEDLSKLARYLNINPDTDIKDKIADAAISIIDRKIHETSPERYYMRFETPGDHEEYSLRKELIDEITKRLSSKDDNKNFGLNEGFKVTIKPLETDFVKRFDEIQARRYTVDIQAMSLVDQDEGSFVSFHVPFSVRSVHEFGWHIFQSKSSQLTKEEQVENLKNVLQDELTRKLQVLPLEMLQYDDYNTLIKIQQAIVDPSTQIVADECGINIHVGQFQRVLSKSERKELKQIKKLNKKQRLSELDMAKKLYDNRGEELQLLLDRKKELLKNLDPDDPELMEVNEQIKKIAPELPEAKVSHKKKKNKKKKTKTSLDDFLLNPGTKSSTDKLIENTKKENKISSESKDKNSDDNIEDATIIE